MISIVRVKRCEPISWIGFGTYRAQRSFYVIQKSAPAALIALLRQWFFNVSGHTKIHTLVTAGAACERK